MSKPAPTLTELHNWPALVSVEQAAIALGISRRHLYELINTDTAPVRVLKLGNVRRVVTASLIEALS